MSLNPNIILQGQQPQFDNPLDSAAKAYTLKRLISQSQREDKELQDQDNINSILKKNVVTGADGRSSLNNSQTLSDLYQVSPQKAMEFQKMIAQFDDSELERITKNAKTLAWSATPDNWSQIKQSAIKLNLPNAEKLPDVYSPQFVERWQMGTLAGEDQLKNRIAQRELEIKEKESGAKIKKDSGTLASDLRKERSGLPTTKATQEISAAYNKIQEAAQNPSAAGDMSLIFGYMKMLDPGSTVREGEFANAQNAAGIDSRVTNAYNRILSGERLAPQQRQDFMNQAGGLYKSQMAIQNQVDAGFKNLAGKSGVDPNDVILNFEANQVRSSPKIQAGHQEDGYIFKGGDPANKSNWERR